MAWPAIAQMAAGSGIQTGSSIWLGAIQNKMQRSQNKKLLQQEYEYNKKLGKFNQGMALDMWDKTNYDAQRKQMEKAGLNVGLMYEGSGTGGTTTTPTGNMSGAKAGTELPNTGMGMQLGMQAAMQKAQIENLNANTDKTKVETAKTAGVDTEKAGAETANTAAQTEIRRIEKELAELDKQVKSATVQTEIKTLEAQKQKLESEARGATVEANVSEKTEAEQIKQRGEGATLEQKTRIAAQKTGIKLTEEQTKKVAADITKEWSDIEKDWADNKINKQEVEIKKMEYLRNLIQTKFNTSDAAKIKQITDIFMGPLAMIAK